jgi:hypothetical protein
MRWTPFPLDVVRVGDPQDLSLGADDSAILIWAEREKRLVATADRRTMSHHLADHLSAGHHSPGVLMLSRGSKISEVLSFLVCVAYASDASEWEDRIYYVPL